MSILRKLYARPRGYSERLLQQQLEICKTYLVRYDMKCLIIWFWIGPDITPSKIMDEFLGMDSCRFRIRHKLTCDMWAIDELHGTFTFRNSYSIPPQYMGDKVDRRILI